MSPPHEEMEVAPAQPLHPCPDLLCCRELSESGQGSTFCSTGLLSLFVSEVVLFSG